jgi:hypothetical protein
MPVAGIKKKKISNIEGRIMNVEGREKPITS